MILFNQNSKLCVENCESVSDKELPKYAIDPIGVISKIRLIKNIYEIKIKDYNKRNYFDKDNR